VLGGTRGHRSMVNAMKAALPFGTIVDRSVSFAR